MWCTWQLGDCLQTSLFIPTAVCNAPVSSCLARCQPDMQHAGSRWYLPPIRGSASNGGNRFTLTRPSRLMGVMGTELLLNGTFFPPGGWRGLMISGSLFFYCCFCITCDVYLTLWRKKKIINLKRREEEGKKKAFACICRQHAHTRRQWHTGTRTAKGIYEWQHQKTLEQLSRWMDAWKLGHRKPWTAWAVFFCLVCFLVVSVFLFLKKKNTIPSYYSNLQHLAFTFEVLGRMLIRGKIWAIYQRLMRSLLSNFTG